ncbi:hypothetical protein GCM10009754_88150 [Amycolatopsis minnesotensis]|uniref:DUF3467 domain-containing protein n=1 Tax=Amycolatopsis minnesotensis TaxID=337894 RepID=A0ABN2SZF1_9PSEU
MSEPHEDLDDPVEVTHIRTIKAPTFSFYADSENVYLNCGERSGPDGDTSEIRMSRTRFRAFAQAVKDTEKALDHDPPSASRRLWPRNTHDSWPTADAPVTPAAGGCCSRCG